MHWISFQKKSWKFSWHQFYPTTIKSHDESCRLAIPECWQKNLMQLCSLNNLLSVVKRSYPFCNIYFHNNSWNLQENIKIILNFFEKKLTFLNFIQIFLKKILKFLEIVQILKNILWISTNFLQKNLKISWNCLNFEKKFVNFNKFYWKKTFEFIKKSIKLSLIFFPSISFIRFRIILNQITRRDEPRAVVWGSNAAESVCRRKLGSNTQGESLVMRVTSIAHDNR